MHRGAGGDTLRAGSTVASPRAWPLLHVAPARNTAGAAPGATRQIFVSFEGPWRFGPMTASAPPCVGRLHGVLAVLRARAGRSRFHRACPMDATLERDAAPVQSAFWSAPTRSHPQRARRRAEQGSLWDVTPETRKGRQSTRLGRLHCRIPASGAPAPSCAGPCSTFRREARIAAVAHARIDQSLPRKGVS